MNEVYQMTEKEFQHKRERLANAKEMLEQSMADMKAAREDGDLSENAAYDAARDKYYEMQKEITLLTNELDNCEIVHDDNTPVIKIGSVINVTRVNEFGEPLGANSPLGKVIIGKTSGIFDIICNGKKRYKVEKVVDA